MNFTNLANVQLFLNKDTLTSNEVATITLLLDMVDDVIRNYCDWNIMAQDYTQTFDGDGTANLDARILPVNSVSSLSIGGVDYTSQVSVDNDNGIIYFDTTTSGQTFTSGSRNIVMTFNAGFTTLPNDLVYAASWLTVINFNRIMAESIGVTTEQFQDIKVEYDKVDIPVMVQHVLDRYRMITIW